MRAMRDGGWVVVVVVGLGNGTFGVLGRDATARGGHQSQEGAGWGCKTKNTRGQYSGHLVYPLATVHGSYF